MPAFDVVSIKRNLEPGNNYPLSPPVGGRLALRNARTEVTPTPPPPQFLPLELPGEELKWTPELPDGNTPCDGVSIFTALQEQLGVGLEAARGPIDVLVIDSVAPPSEN